MVEITPVIDFGEKTGFSIMAALDDVLGNPRDHKAGFACHVHLLVGDRVQWVWLLGMHLGDGYGG